MNYVSSIEPRLTPHRPVAPTTATRTLEEWIVDLVEETVARLDLMSAPDLAWSPHPDANSSDVTVWHIARWMDFLGTRAFTGAGVRAEVWHRDGWADRTGYDPTGVGYLGLGTLTGYSPAEMRAVPRLSCDSLRDYVEASASTLRDLLLGQSDGWLHAPQSTIGMSPYQVIGGTVQGSFGHLGEIDCLVALRGRIIATSSDATA